MRLLMDTIQYTLFPGIRRDALGFAEATYQIRTEFGSGAPFEWRVAWPVMRDLMRSIEEQYDGLATRLTSVTLGEDGYKIVGVPVKVLPDSYDDDTVMAVIKVETLAVPYVS